MMFSSSSSTISMASSSSPPSSSSSSSFHTSCLSSSIRLRPRRSSPLHLLLAIPLLFIAITILALFSPGGPANSQTNLRVKRHTLFEGRLHRQQTMIREQATVFGIKCQKRNGTNAKTMEAFGEEDSQFPGDLFTLEQRKRGAVVLHLFGLIYMFIALAIVCDEFFVPSLAVITERLDISDDVAGATFMAAGGSAPEFFTSVVGTFVAQNNVGIGTIVGSATFNILCVLAFCTIFSREVLQLSWWPLFRDISFYVISLLILVGSFLDEQILWWEALALFSVYIGYALFMKYNSTIEIVVKKRFGWKIEEEEGEEEAEGEEEEGRPLEEAQTAVTEWRKTTKNGGGKGSQQQQQQQKKPNEATAELLGEHQQHQQQQKAEDWASRRSHLQTIHHQSLQRSDTVSAHRTFQPRASMRRRQSSIPGHGGRRQSIPILHSGAMFRNGIISLMSQTLDPLSEAMDNGEAEEQHRSRTNSTGKNGGAIVQQQQRMTNGTTGEQQQHQQHPHRDKNGNMPPRQFSTNSSNDQRVPRVEFFEEIKSVLEEEGEKPLDMSWPARWHKQILYVFLWPILFPLWLTMADVRRPEKRKYFPATFFLSILWIAVFSYLMVWLANTIGLTLGITTEVLGLTILAAGTSIPDLITSVIVARKGLGDMAVSSSVGSNIFDVCVGLPIPWLLFFICQFLRSSSPHTFASFSVQSIPVSSNGLVCSVGMLFLMLLLLLAAIALCGWRMNKAFGCTMIIGYLIFCALSILLEIGRLECPLRLC